MDEEMSSVTSATTQKDVISVLSRVDRGLADGNFRVPIAVSRPEQTGERLISGTGGQVEIEHFHRYCLARDLAVGLDVLDLASGEGYGSAMLAGVARSVIGVDIDPATTEHSARAYSAPNLEFRTGDALAIPLPDSSVDLVVSFETLEHFADHDGFCREVRRVLRPGGIFIVSTPNRTVYSAHAEPINEYHVRELVKDEFSALLDRYFARQIISEQRAIIGSVTTAARAAEESWRNFERRGQLIEATSGLARAYYFIGIASDGALPALPASTYVQSGNVDHALRTVEAHAGLLARTSQLDAELAQQREAQTVLVAELAQQREVGARLIADYEASLAGLLPEVERTVEACGLLRRQSAELMTRHDAIARQLAEAREAAATAEQRLHDIEHSETWRATRPLRTLLTNMPGVAVLLRKATKVLWWTVTLQLPRRLRDRRASLAAPLPAAVPIVPNMHVSAARHALAAVVVPHANPPEPPPRLLSVDIVICVHNALDDVRRCLGSVKQHTLPPYRLILVDDGSAAPTEHFLSAFAREHGAMLIRHEQARGYTCAANAGLRASSAPLVLLLNSDTEATEGWLDRMADLLDRYPEVGLVGPLSNIASWQSTPRLMEGDDWAPNELPPGTAANDVARIVTDGSPRNGVEIGFLNGFCLLIRRAVLDGIGVFDEGRFGAGYGEENDFCIRARNAGWRLMVADDAYVLHHQSRSYGNERRLKLARSADEMLARTHDHTHDIAPFVERARDSLILAQARERVGLGLRIRDLVEQGKAAFQGRRLGIMLPVGAPGGGANVVLQEAIAAQAFGVDTWIINRASAEWHFRRAYPDLALPVLYAPDDDVRRFVETAAADLGFDAVLATAAASFDWLPPPRSGLVLGYYIQDNEPRFFEPSSKEYQGALASYQDRPEVRRLTKTSWNAEAVRNLGGMLPRIIGASVDLGRCRPMSDSGLDNTAPVRVVAMVRPCTPRRNPVLTLRVLRELHDALPGRVEVACFGATLEEYLSLGIPLDGLSLYGELAPEEVAVVLGNTDVFLDLSEWQAMGLTALEAMASAAAVVAPRNGGTTDFCQDGVNALLVDTADFAACVTAGRRLVEDHALRLRLRHEGLRTAYRFPPVLAARAMLEALFDA